MDSPAADNNSLSSTSSGRGADVSTVCDRILKQIRDQAEREKSELRRDIETSKSEVAEWRSLIRKQHRQLLESSSRIESDTAAIERHERDIKAGRESLQQLDRQALRIASRRESGKHLVAKLAEGFERFTSDLCAEKRKEAVLREEAERKIKDVEREIKHEKQKNEEDLMNYRKTIDAIKHSYDEKNALAKEIKKSLDERQNIANDEHIRATSELEKYKKDFEQTQENIKKEEKKCKILDEDQEREGINHSLLTKEYEERIEGFALELKKIKCENTIREKTLADLTVNNEELNARADFLEERIENLRTKNAVFCNELKELNATKNEATKHHEELKNQESIIQNNLSVLSNKILDQKDEEIMNDNLKENMLMLHKQKIISWKREISYLQDRINDVSIANRKNAEILESRKSNIASQNANIINVKLHLNEKLKEKINQETLLENKNQDIMHIMEDVNILKDKSQSLANEENEMNYDFDEKSKELNKLMVLARQKKNFMEAAIELRNRELKIRQNFEELRDIAENNKICENSASKSKDVNFKIPEKLKVKSNTKTKVDANITSYKKPDYPKTIEPTDIETSTVAVEDKSKDQNFKGYEKAIKAGTSEKPKKSDESKITKEKKIAETVESKNFNSIENKDQNKTDRFKSYLKFFTSRSTDIEKPAGFLMSDDMQKRSSIYDCSSDSDAGKEKRKGGKRKASGANKTFPQKKKSK